MKVTEEIKEKIFELRKEGLSLRKIAKEVNLSYTAVRYHLVGDLNSDLNTDLNSSKNLNSDLNTNKHLQEVVLEVKELRECLNHFSSLFKSFFEQFQIFSNTLKQQQEDIEALKKEISDLKVEINSFKQVSNTKTPKKEKKKISPLNNPPIKEKEKNNISFSSKEEKETNPYFDLVVEIGKILQVKMNDKGYPTKGFINRNIKPAKELLNDSWTKGEIVKVLKWRLEHDPEDFWKRTLGGSASPLATIRKHIDSWYGRMRQIEKENGKRKKIVFDSSRVSEEYKRRILEGLEDHILRR